MSSSPGIFYVAPDSHHPVGGVKQIYRHVDILCKKGFPASVVHEQPGFRCTWFENSTRTTSFPELLSSGLQREDFVVLPEILGPAMAKLARGHRKVIFNQNCYYTFLHYPVEAPPAAVPYLDKEVVAAMVVSKDSFRYLRFAFPHLPVARIHNGLDFTRFSSSAEKRRRIAFMATKNEGDVTQVINLLRLRGKIGDHELVCIRDKSESEVAAILREATIFLSFGNREGFSLPPAEAMACGCIVVGYHGGGGSEFLLPEHSYPIADGDILRFVETVEEVVAAFASDPHLMEEKARAASRFIHETYALQREEREVVSLWSRLTGQGSSTPSAAPATPARSRAD